METKGQRQRRGYTALNCNAESRGCRFAEGNEQDSEDGEEVAVGRISQRDSSQATLYQNHVMKRSCLFWSFRL